jgi:hypothetical protein
MLVVGVRGSRPAKAALSRSSCCTERSERISSIACPSKAWATVSIAASALSSTSAEVPRRHIALHRIEHRGVDAGLGELLGERRGLAALGRHVLLGLVRRGVVRPADHGDVLNVDEVLVVELLEPEDGRIGPSLPLNRSPA